MSDVLDSIEKDQKTKFDLAFRSFLEAHPDGGRRPWHGAAAGPPQTPPLIGEVPGVFGVEELRSVLSPYGDDSDADDDDEDADPEELHFWHRKLLPHAYVIASSYSGDPVIQVARGKYAGRVLLTNHEAWHGGFQFLSGHVGPDDVADAEEFVEAAGLSSLEELSALSTDQIVEILLTEELDGAIELGASFPEFYRNLLAAHADT